MKITALLLLGVLAQQYQDEFDISYAPAQFFDDSQVDEQNQESLFNDQDNNDAFYQEDDSNFEEDAAFDSQEVQDPQKYVQQDYSLIDDMEASDYVSKQTDSEEFEEKQDSEYTLNDQEFESESDSEYVLEDQEFDDEKDSEYTLDDQESQEFDDESDSKVQEFEEETDSDYALEDTDSQEYDDDEDFEPTFEAVKETKRKNVKVARSQGTAPPKRKGNPILFFSVIGGFVALVIVGAIVYRVVKKRREQRDQAAPLLA
jgi:ABC-type antimicrobial peptide transport system permease subunit